MKLVALISILLVAASAQSEVVKITGADCRTKSAPKNGSGIIFNINNEQFVVSSEHVTPGGGQLCFSAQTPAGNKTALTLISSDWETGLSLLKVNTPLSNIKTDLADFETNPVQMQMVDVIAEGFPAASLKLLTDKTRIAISQSDRTPFVSSTNMIEVIGTQFEFGMSGGALLTAQDKKILGMISHQKLVIIPGQSTSFETSTQQKENHGLVIPSSQITTWIQKTLNGSSSIYTQSSDQSILGAGILFREIKQLPILLASSKKGGDGVGVGGEEDQSASVSLVISVSALDSFNAHSTKRPEFTWIQQILPQLVKNNSITVSAVLFLNPETETIEKIPIKSTAQFIKMLRSGSCIPVVNTAGAVSSNLEELRKDLLQLPSNPQLITLNSLLLSLIELKSEYGLVTIPANYLTSLQKHPGWKIFFEENFELAVKAKTFAMSL